MAVVGLHRRVTEPGTQLVQRREVVLDVPEGSGSLAPRQILQQLGRPGVRLSRAVPDNAGDDGVVQEQIVGAGRQLKQAVRYRACFPERSCSSIHS
jgi:hypothetical protein